MEENIPKLNQEKNLALERQEAVKLHNEILKEGDSFSEEDKKWNIEKGSNNNPQYTENFSKMIDLRKNVENIDKYKELAKSKENVTTLEVSDISNVEKIKQEKLKIDKEIEKTKNDIASTANKLNELRSKLGLSPSEDIPSLIDKKENLENLLMIQKELESRLSFEDKKIEIRKEKNSENNKIEDKNLNEKSEEIKRFEGNLKNVIDDISNNAKTMMDALYERQQRRLTPIQNNDQFQMMASSIKNLKNFEYKIDTQSVSEIITNIGKLSRMFDEFRVQRTSQINEDFQNLDKLAFSAKRFAGSTQEDSRKLPIQMEDKQMEAKSKELRLAIQKLSEQSQKLWVFAMKLRENTRY